MVAYAKCWSGSPLWFFGLGLTYLACNTCKTMDVECYQDKGRYGDYTNMKLVSLCGLHWSILWEWLDNSSGFLEFSLRHGRSTREWWDVRVVSPLGDLICLFGRLKPLCKGFCVVRFNEPKSYGGALNKTYVPSLSMVYWQVILLMFFLLFLVDCPDSAGAWNVHVRGVNLGPLRDGTVTAVHCHFCCFPNLTTSKINTPP